MKQNRGLLITNGFLRTRKFVEHYQWLKEAALKHGIALDLMENHAHLMEVEEEPQWLDSYDFVIFWDKDIPLGKSLSDYGDRHNIPIYNDPESIAVCDNKYETYLCISRWNRIHPRERIKILPTVMAPMTYPNVGYSQVDFLNQVEERLGYPMVVKECCGSFGMQVYLAKNHQELLELTYRLAGTPFFYQKYIAFRSGCDVRLQVVGDRVVAAMERCAQKGDFRANITNGGSMKPYHPSEREQELAVRVTKVLGLDFAGVDVLFSRESGEADILCEVNSNAHFKNIYHCTGVNVAQEILSYILDR